MDKEFALNQTKKYSELWSVFESRNKLFDVSMEKLIVNQFYYTLFTRYRVMLLTEKKEMVGVARLLLNCKELYNSQVNQYIVSEGDDELNLIFSKKGTFLGEYYFIDGQIMCEECSFEPDPNDWSLEPPE